MKWIGKVRLGRVLLALYAFFCMFVQFSSNGFAVDYAKKLYFEYADKYPKEVVVFLWGFESSVNNISGVIIGFLAGLLIAIFMYVLVNSSVQASLRGALFKLRAVIVGT